MALLLEEEEDHNREDKRSNKAQRADKLRNLKRQGEFVIVAKQW